MKKIIFVIVCMLLFSAFGFVEHVSASSSWSVETVDSTANVGVSNSIAVDSNGHPHISYYDTTNGRLKYARWTGSSWSLQMLVPFGQYCSIAIDNNNFPHISFYDSINKYLRCARWTGSTWDFQTVDTIGDVGQHTSIAIDSSNNVHISYYDASNRNLKYARRTGNIWDVQTVDDNGNVGIFSSIALDSNDNPHISYLVETSFDLKYARWTGSSWDVQTVEVIENPDLIARGTSIALDSNDNPHISYCDINAFNLKYARWTGSRWNIQTIDDEGITGLQSSIALDSNDNPHISYYRTIGLTDWPLRYARWTGDSWNIQTIDIGTRVSGVTAIALDESNNPHISYYDLNNQNLKYATYPITFPSAPSNLQATPGDTQISLSWNAPLDDGGGSITGYRIYRGAFSGSLSYQGSVSGTTFSYMDTGLTNGEKSYYQISAVNSAGEGELTNEVSATPLGLPSSPRNLQATPGDEQVVLSWDPPLDDGGSVITVYRIYQGNSSGALTYHESVAGDIFTYDHTGLTNGKTYYYQVSAVTTSGEGQRTSEDSATPPGKLTAPENVEVEAGDELVVISWDVPSYDGGFPITAYYIYRGMASETISVYQSVDNDTLSYTDIGLINGQMYYYQVAAVNAEGEGDRSIERSVTPVGLPSAPENLLVFMKDKEVVLSWDPPADDGGSRIIQYEIYKGTSPDALTFLTNVTDTLYTDQDVSDKKQYYYQIIAVNDAGSGIQSLVESTVEEEVSILVLFIIVGVIIAIVIFFAILKKKDGGLSQIFSKKTSKNNDLSSQKNLVTARLEELQKLKEKNLITEEEFKQKKKDILDKL